MSQAAIKSSRPLSLSQTTGKQRSTSSRPNTPQTGSLQPPIADKTDSRSSTPIIIIDDSPKSKRRPSRDSPKVKPSPKTVEVEEKQGTNGNHAKEPQNGTNGNSSVPETPKSTKKQKKEEEEVEMEPLVVEADQPVDPTPETPKASGKVQEKGRILTPRQGPPASRTKPFQKEPVQSASMIVNLSTVSEQNSDAAAAAR